MTVPALQNTSVFYRRVLSQFPQDISLAFAYGSGVFKQAGTPEGQMGVSQRVQHGIVLPVNNFGALNNAVCNIVTSVPNLCCNLNMLSYKGTA